MSIESSFWEANSESDEENHISLDELRQSIARSYEPSIIHQYSSALDILASFIKSQSFIYNEASYYCRFRLNLLMFPCIFLSSLCSVLATTQAAYIPAMNAFISFLLSIVNFLQLDAHAEAHQISSNHYSKLRVTLEFSSGELLLFSNPLLQNDGIHKEMESWKRVNPGKKTDDKMDLLCNEHDKLKHTLILSLQEKITGIKKKVIEIRETNRFSVPKYISARYPIIFNINIFSFIKTVSDYRNNLISTLKNIKNEIRYLSHLPTLNDIQSNRIKELYADKLDIMKELFALSSTYNLIDIMFQQEIKNNHLFKHYFYLFYLQKIISLFSNKSILPEEYKHPYDCGYFDKRQNKSLLRKILNV